MYGRVVLCQEMVQQPCLRLLPPPPTTSLGSLQNFMRKLVGDPGAGRLVPTLTAEEAATADAGGRLEERGEGRESGRGTG